MLKYETRLLIHGLRRFNKNFDILHDLSGSQTNWRPEVAASLQSEYIKNRQGVRLWMQNWWGRGWARHYTRHLAQIAQSSRTRV